jgi:opacity protein-like surface antigen
MRILPLLVAAAALAVVAQAQAAHPKHSHPTLTQRFEQANVTHDGHLTLDQAKAGYKSVAKHFSDIDKDNKGYVTEDDIRAYYKAQRASHHQPSAEHNQPG